MSESEDRPRPGAAGPASFGKREGLQESLDELAANVDSLVDRLTMGMGDTPIEEPPESEPEAGVGKPEASAALTSARTVERPEPMIAAAKGPGPAAASAAAASAEDDSEDINALTDRLVDSLLAGPGPAAVAPAPEPEASVAAAGSPVEGLREEPLDLEVETTEVLAAAEATLATEPAAEESLIAAELDRALAGSPTRGEVPPEPAVKSTEARPALDVTVGADEPAVERPAAGASPPHPENVVIPWSAPEGAATRAPSGRTWKIAASGIFIALAASAAWVMFSPDGKPPEMASNAALPLNALAGPVDPQPELVTPYEPPEPEPSPPDPTAAPVQETSPEPPPATKPAAPKPPPAAAKPVAPKPAAAAAKRVAPKPASAASKPAPKKKTAPPPKPAAAVAQKTEPSPRPARAFPPPPPVEPTAKPEPAPAEIQVAKTEPRAARPTESTRPAPSGGTTKTASLVPAVATPPAKVRPPAPAGVQPPQLLERQEPTYPERARKKRKGGVIQLRVLVNEKGQVMRVVVERGIPGSELEARAVDAALRSTYSPATENGRTVRAWVTERFVFEP